MSDAVILWEGKELSSDALARIKEELAFTDKADNGNTVQNEIAITFSHATGYYIVYKKTFYRNSGRTALSDGFVARTGFQN